MLTKPSVMVPKLSLEDAIDCTLDEQFWLDSATVVQTPETFAAHDGTAPGAAMQDRVALPSPLNWSSQSPLAVSKVNAALDRMLQQGVSKSRDQSPLCVIGTARAQMEQRQEMLESEPSWVNQRPQQVGLSWAVEPSKQLRVENCSAEQPSRLSQAETMWTNQLAQRTPVKTTLAHHQLQQRQVEAALMTRSQQHPEISIACSSARQKDSQVDSFWQNQQVQQLQPGIPETKETQREAATYSTKTASLHAEMQSCGGCSQSKTIVSDIDQMDLDLARMDFTSAHRLEYSELNKKVGNAETCNDVNDCGESECDVATTEKPHNLLSYVLRCELCNKCFTSAFNLKRHTQAVHHADRSFECETCGMRFKLKESLVSHRRCVHRQGAQLYQCSSCSKSFARKGNAERHYMERHSKVKPFCCSVCPRQFGSRYNLLRHQKSSHN
uniref:C2H2-type domain-containing protein n=1 Tax=Erythrolobus australicus TaxID=1077150 RepID=A0A7S1TMR7_9RHOD|mmetsp:Transcript_777/g.2104  ORF Transcript_777/g.2104 Transcript_777/m.2104 type:complete len:440 (+) Transcript_777:263-1582(+)|eukprot:CAMPEP_0185842086 /NCGR_PEP_ID=MMETSP1353-20130828/18228_1 /TAXON_ID=1077150 /ORGANISM="Erythrolobus australicus, Strain CCMP3124" /LENGTH=439 /DNA_ID=CAMNT_0028541583 /DNA_START=237 /DNA_END=1556 /DNA_ORIENTATION=+